MKRETERRVVAIICTIAIVIAVIASGAMPVFGNDGGRMIEKSFRFGRYAPEVTFYNAGMSGRALQVNSDGSVAWAKADRSKWSQSFIILPAKETGHFIIQEFTSNPYQRVLTYTSKGFRMEYPQEKNGMPSFARTQMFRFKWYTSTKVGTKTIKNCWKLVCRENNMCFCTGGWSTLETMQTNWSTDY